LINGRIKGNKKNGKAITMNNLLSGEKWINGKA